MSTRVSETPRSALSVVCNYSAGCPEKDYTGRDPNLDERRQWEVKATKCYQFLQKKYQDAIEKLRLM